MRGKDLESVMLEQTDRITPAYAGKSLWQYEHCNGKWDHPRVCGEKGGQQLQLVYEQGSPPRMRGKVFRSSSRAASSRITPAYAGKSGHCQAQAGSDQDHPRVCGEKRRAPWRCPSASGSPPRMRGKAFSSIQPARISGITPAYAGKSLPLKNGIDFLGDHPRVCGEKLDADGAVVEVLGITPAYAGKS